MNRERRARRPIGKCSQRDRHHDIWLPVLQDGKSKSEDWSDLFEHGEASAFRSQRSLQRNLCAPAQATQAAVWGNSDAYLQLMVERDGNQRLKLVVLDCLKIFREIMRYPEWMDQFDLTSNCPPPPPSLSLNFDGESTLRWFAPVAAAVPGRRSSQWPSAPTCRRQFCV